MYLLYLSSRLSGGMRFWSSLSGNTTCTMCSEGQNRMSKVGERETARRTRNEFQRKSSFFRPLMSASRRIASGFKR